MFVSDHKSNMFITDGHDIEMMMADSEFETELQREFLDGEQIPIMKAVEMDIRHLSYIKWLNDREHYSLKVRHLKPANGIYDGNNELSVKKCLEQLYCKASNTDGFVLSCDDVVQFENDNPTEDYRNLTNGHDLYEGICRKIYFEKANNNYSDAYKPKSEDISRMARAAYSAEKFSRTNMFRKIKNWQSSVGCHIVVER